MSEQEPLLAEPGRPESVWQVIFNRRMLICIMIGFSSGLPLYILYQLIPAWLRDQGVSLETIGLFSLVAFPYTWKFLWSPALDRYIPPLFGRRRGWMFITQLALLVSIAAFALFNPTESITSVAYVVFAVAFLVQLRISCWMPTGVNCCPIRSWGWAIRCL